MLITAEDKNILVELIKKRYDYDFSDYSESSLIRRISNYCISLNIRSFFDLKHGLINDKGIFEGFVNEITVNVTEMYREPDFFSTLIKNVYPSLDTYPFINIWHAGCSTGEEVLSNAILLEENNLYDKSRIFATDINSEVIRTAKSRAYSIKTVKESSKNYKRSGGKYSLSDYYEIEDDHTRFDPSLLKNVTFSSHNLVSDSSFKEFNLIVCRNVIIYFNMELQERVFKLFYDSLPMLGYLALGSKETLDFSSLRSKFEIVSRVNKIYRKIG